MAVQHCTCGLDLVLLPSGKAAACTHCDVPCTKTGAEQYCFRCDRIGIKRSA